MLIEQRYEWSEAVFEEINVQCVHGNSYLAAIAAGGLKTYRKVDSYKTLKILSGWFDKHGRNYKCSLNQDSLIFIGMLTSC